MTFREKSAWASLLATAIVFVPYFRDVFARFAQDSLQPEDVLGGFIGAVIYLTMLEIVAAIAVAILSRRSTTDERDAAIDARSFKGAYYVLSVSGMLVILAVTFLAVVPVSVIQDRALAPAFLSQVLLLCFVLAEAVKSLVQIVSYRRGY